MSSCILMEPLHQSLGSKISTLQDKILALRGVAIHAMCNFFLSIVPCKLSPSQCDDLGSSTTAAGRSVFAELFNQARNLEDARPANMEAEMWFS